MYKRMGEWGGREVIDGSQLSIDTGSWAVCSVVDRNSHSHVVLIAEAMQFTNLCKSCGLKIFAIIAHDTDLV